MLGPQTKCVWVKQTVRPRLFRKVGPTWPGSARPTHGVSGASKTSRSFCGDPRLCGPARGWASS
jgi:hypothetical protein